MPVIQRAMLSVTVNRKEPDRTSTAMVRTSCPTVAFGHRKLHIVVILSLHGALRKANYREGSIGSQRPCN